MSAALHAGAADTDASARLVVQETNAFRKAQGLAALAVEESLEKAARQYAQHMAKAGKLGHRVDGRQPAERAQAHGYEACIVAENVGYQYRSRGYDAPTLAAALVEGWTKSPGHRENLQDAALTEIGVGIAQDAKGRYFGVQFFGRPQRDAIRFSVRNEAGRQIAYRAGQQELSLPPRATRTHMVCRPVMLSVDSIGFSMTAVAGTRYTVRATGVDVRKLTP